MGSETVPEMLFKFHVPPWFTVTEFPTFTVPVTVVVGMLSIFTCRFDPLDCVTVNGLAPGLTVTEFPTLIVPETGWVTPDPSTLSAPAVVRLNGFVFPVV